MVALSSFDMMGRIKNDFSMALKLKKEMSIEAYEIDLNDPNITPMKKLQMFLK